MFACGFLDYKDEAIVFTHIQPYERVLTRMSDDPCYAPV